MLRSFIPRNLQRGSREFAQYLSTETRIVNAILQTINPPLEYQTIKPFISFEITEWRSLITLTYADTYIFRGIKISPQIPFIA